MSQVNISGLDKVKLLHALWEKQVPASFFSMNGETPPKYDHDSAKKAVKCSIDYFCGRAIKANLSEDIVNPSLYNRDAGKGVFEKVVRSLK